MLCWLFEVPSHRLMKQMYHDRRRLVVVVIIVAAVVSVRLLHQHCRHCLYCTLVLAALSASSASSFCRLNSGPDLQFVSVFDS